MNAFQALILGAVQGLTEFLPISSSGHLVLVQAFLGFSESLVEFDVILHIGTLFAVFLFFYKKILSLRWPELWVIGVGTIPAVVVGFLFKEYIETAFATPLYVAVEIMISGGFNFYTHYLLNKKQPEVVVSEIGKISNRQATFIGVLQAISISPGISRSGATVWAGVFSKLNRQTAFEYSFLLSIPAILGAVVLELADGISFAAVPAGPMLIGLVTSFVLGLATLKLLQYMIQKANFAVFGWYCIVLGIASFFVLQ